METTSDYVSDIIDEIALEGLDGITLQGLWLRLSLRPGFVLKPTDDLVKRYLWKIISKIPVIEFYLLPTARGDLVLHRRRDHIDSIGYYKAPENYKCIYEHAAVSDQERGIMGSCPTYKTREDVTGRLRREDYQTALSYGNRLVIVADQISRNQALFSSGFNPTFELGILPYCCLERIARSRYEGELTQGKQCLRMVTNDSKSLFYYRMILVKNKIIKRQPFYMRRDEAGGEATCGGGSVLHLNRFYTEMKQMKDSGAEMLVTLLSGSPNQCVPLTLIHGQTFESIKGIIAKYPKNFKKQAVPYKELHPNAEPSEYKLKNGNERKVRILKLLDPNLGRSSELEDEEEEEEVENPGLIDESRRVLNGSLLRLAWLTLEKAGPPGLKQGGLAELMALPSLIARNLLKLLMRAKLIKSVRKDSGRQRAYYYYCSKFDKAESCLMTEIKEEKNKLLDAICASSSVSGGGGEEGEEGGATAPPGHSSQESSTPAPLQLSATTSSAAVADPEEIAAPPLVEVTEGTSQTSTDTGTGESAEVQIRTEIVCPRMDPGKEPSKGFTELLRDLDAGIESPNSSTTSRMIKRASLIVQSINLHRVIQDTHKVHRMVKESEELEGLKEAADRKTILRLLDKLESDGLLKKITVNLTGYGKTKTMQFICHPSVTETHSEILSAIDQAKMKLPTVSAYTSRCEKKNSEEMHKEMKYPPLKRTRAYARLYGLKPKFVRMRILHVYLYYLIYGYEGDPKLDQSCKEEILRQAGIEDSSILEEMSFAYRKELDWKTFLPPLPVHSGYSDGWCLLSDTLLRLPLCLYLSVIPVHYNIPGLTGYLKHPVKRYLLVKDLPQDIQHYLTYERKYIFVVSDVIARLGFIGLTQMGPQKLKDKDQVYIYLNKNAVLYNTTISDTGYYYISQNKVYESVRYHFSSIDDVEQYWYDLWNFAMNTNLGIRSMGEGGSGMSELVSTKKDYQDTLQVRSPEEAVALDVGYLPGDHLGAAGLDSDMFVHLKRNWYWSSNVSQASTDVNKTYLFPPVVKKRGRAPSIRGGGERLDHRPPEVRSGGGGGGSKVPSRKEAKTAGSGGPSGESLKTKSLKLLPSSWGTRAVPKKKTRVVRSKKPLQRKPYYDQKDKDALSKMVKLRVDWSSVEDNLLLICKVASLYLSPNKKRSFTKNFLLVREILHSAYPDLSKNKTSRACQRRIHYMMKNPFTVRSVYLCLEEVRQDPEIRVKFHNVVENLEAEIKATGGSVQNSQDKFNKIYQDLVSTLIKKLKTIADPERLYFEVELPNTVAEFEKKYDTFLPSPTSLIRSFSEVQRVIDIMCSVINSVIFSSLSCVNEKTSFSNQLFYIYQQYPDKLLRHVMAKCRRWQIISSRKRFIRWKSFGNDCLPLASSPYQLSIRYVHLLQSRYQYPTFYECHEGLKSLLEVPEAHAPKKGRRASKDSAKPLPEAISKEVLVNTGGQCANIVELFTLGLIKMEVEFPEQIITLDPRLSETEETYQLIMNRFREVLSVVRNKDDQSKKAYSSDEEDEDVDEQKDESVVKTDEKRGGGGGGVGLEEFNLKNKAVVANTASRLALYMMRDEPETKLDSSLQHAHDFFVLNPCKVSVQLERREIERVVFYNERKNKILAEIKKMATFPEVVRENNDVANELGAEYASLALEMLEYIESEKELGTTFDDLKKLFSLHSEFISTLRILVDERYILRTGVVSVRFVHPKFAKPWLIKSFHLLRHAREALGREKTNSAYAISFSKTEGPVKKRLSGTALSESGPKKKAKLDRSIEQDVKSDSVDLQAACEDSRLVDDLTSSNLGHDSSEPPPAKKLRTSGDLGESTSSSDVNADKKKGGETDIKKKGDEDDVEKKDEEADVKMTDEEQDLKKKMDDDDLMKKELIKKKVEEENSVTPVAAGPSQQPSQSRFLIKTTSKRWIAVPNEGINKFDNLDPTEGSIVYVKIRPWVKVDGTVNRRVLDRLLGSVLGGCLTQPGISLTRLQQLLSPALQPVHVYELLEILEKIKCVKMIELKKSWKCSLASKRCPVMAVPSEGPVRSVVIEPEALAISRLAFFIGDRGYNVDYLAQLSFTSKDGPLL